MITVIFLFFLFLSCGESPQSTVLSDAQSILITDYSFAPSEITVSPGDVIFFQNNDNVTHIIKSQSDIDQFDDNGDFTDVILTPGSSNLLEVPDTTASGTILYFYTESFQDSFSTPNGMINVN